MRIVNVLPVDSLDFERSLKHKMELKLFFFQFIFFQAAAFESQLRIAASECFGAMCVVVVH